MIAHWPINPIELTSMLEGFYRDSLKPDFTYVISGDDWSLFKLYSGFVGQQYSGNLLEINDKEINPTTLVVTTKLGWKIQIVPKDMIGKISFPLLTFYSDDGDVNKTKTCKLRDQLVGCLSPIFDPSMLNNLRTF